MTSLSICKGSTTWICTFVLLVAALNAHSASSKAPSPPITYIPAQESDPAHPSAKYDASTVQQSYVALAGGLYSNALGGALALSKATEAFSDAPNTTTLLAARAAWASARSAYLVTAAFRACGGPIDGAKSAVRAEGPELSIDKNFIALERALASNELIFELTKKSTGAAARKTLAAATSALQSDLTFVLKEWDPIRRTSYAQEFLQLEGSEAIGRLLRGLGMQANALSNMPASAARDDHVNAILSGMHSIWHAQLNKITAPSVNALLVKIDPDAAAAVSGALATAQTQANANDPALPATLQKLALAIANAGTRLGVVIAIAKR